MFGSQNRRRSLDQLRDYQFLKKGSALPLGINYEKCDLNVLPEDIEI
jgi:hypothetical protein